MPQVQDSLRKPLNYDGIAGLPGQGRLDEWGNEVEQATYDRGRNLVTAWICTKTD